MQKEFYEAQTHWLFLACLLFENITEDKVPCIALPVENFAHKNRLQQLQLGYINGLDKIETSSF